jgi:hypothetical protein
MKLRFFNLVKISLATALLLGASHHSIGQNPIALAAPNMTSQAGFNTTCTALKKIPANQASTLTKQNVQAWVICNDIALLQQTAAWAFNAFKRLDSRGADGIDLKNTTFVNFYIQTQLSYMQSQLSASRLLLRDLKIEAKDSLQLRPQTWALDIDGDGAVTSWERRFFALPNRSNDTEPSFDMPGDSDNVQMQALIKTDQTDVLWALSYHQFIEGLVEMARSQTLNTSSENGFNDMLNLTDKSAWARAYGLIKDGFATSQTMRTAALAETDDDYEWLPNPNQKNSAFPLLLDKNDYATWGNTLAEINLLWTGKTLLEPSNLVRGILGSAARWCEPDSGLDVIKLFGDQAPRSLLNLGQYTQACSPLSAERPSSNLLKTLETRAATGDMSSKMLRYLYWVN